MVASYSKLPCIRRYVVDAACLAIFHRDSPRYGFYEFERAASIGRREARKREAGDRWSGSRADN